MIQFLHLSSVCINERERMLSDIQALILAADKSTKLPSNNTKLIEKICGQELIIYPLTVLHECAIPTTIVIDFQGTAIKNIVEQRYPQQLQFREQKAETGNASATLLTQKEWHAQNILIMKANIPLITPEIIENLYTTHVATNAAISFVAAHHEDSTNTFYRRVITKKKNIYIREHGELSRKEIEKNCYVNGDIYLISRSFLEKHINQIGQNKFTHEYHFSDLVNIATHESKIVSMVLAPFDQIRGVDTYQDVWVIEQIKRAELIRFWMDRGVRFSAAQNVHLDRDVQIGAGTFIGNSVHLLKGSRIGTNAIIDAFSIIDHATLGNDVTIHSHSIVKDSTIGDHSQIGPFAHIQSDTIVGNYCALGNFVETKRTKIGDHSKAKHLTYLGDAQIGARVNIGAGTITCNYNGKTKETTHIEDNVFVGSNNSLVAPVTIGKEAFTAAGSVITQNVPAQALAIGRARQVNKEGYARAFHANEISSEEHEDTKQPVSFVGATKSSSIDL